METLVEIQDLKVGFPARSGGWFRKHEPLFAVNGVSLDIAEGTTLGLVGESGCGKTTLGRAILRLVEPSSGTICFSGKDITRWSGRSLRQLRRDMQIVFQDPLGSLNPRMTLEQILWEPYTIHASVSRSKRRESSANLLFRVGLSDAYLDRYPHELSGGQRQRVGIARSIALSPKFIVCDEPVSALDVSIQAQILRLLEELKRDLSLTYLFIAHNLAVIERISDRVAVMYLGKVVEIGNTVDVFKSPQHPYTQALLASVPDLHATKEIRVPIMGEPPDPANPPSGCAFHPRCPIATERCRNEAPKLEALSVQAPSHQVACHYAEATYVK
ncbi:MAG: ABC transporter ATP-binding protein [Planctomycetota bacterium]